MATLEGTIQPPSADWDPYAPPGSTPPSLLPQEPYLTPSPFSSPEGVYTTMRRFLDEIRLDYVWMPGDAEKELGINDVELGATFAIPFLYNTETPLLVTPGFAIHYWQGPNTSLVDLPPRVYDAYLDAAWNPQLMPWFGGELDFRIGVYSDFDRVTEKSLRYMGKALAVLTFTQSIKVKAGVWYIDRNRIQILPAGGVIWTPNEDVRFEMLFPNPKLAFRLSNVGNTQWWWYTRGEYGGGAWTIMNGANQISMDYNDIRVALGLEFEQFSGPSGLFEVGVAFERELYDIGPWTKYPLNSTVFLRGGLAY
jgi:hypothetical protein